MVAITSDRYVVMLNDWGEINSVLCKIGKRFCMSPCNGRIKSGAIGYCGIKKAAEVRAEVQKGLLSKVEIAVQQDDGRLVVVARGV